MARSRSGWRSPARLAVGAIGLFTITTMLWLAVWALLPVAAGLQPVTVVSGSMAPAVRNGDVVLVGPETELEVDHVVVFRDGAGSLITHRVVEVLEDGRVRTRGDANQHWDSAPVELDQVVGVGRLLVPYAGMPRLWVSQGEHVRVVTWIVGTLAALAAATLLLTPPTGTGSGRESGATPGQRKSRPVPARTPVRPRAAWASFARLVGTVPSRRWIGGAGLVLAVIGPVGLVTAVAAFANTTTSVAKFTSGEWVEPALYTASSDATARKVSYENNLLWQTGDRVVLKDDMAPFEKWEPVGGGSATGIATPARGTEDGSLRRDDAGGATGGATKLLWEPVGDGWVLEAWTRHPNPWHGESQIGLEDAAGNGYSVALGRSTLRIDRRGAGVPEPLPGAANHGNLNFNTWYRLVLVRVGTSLTASVFSETGTQPLSEVNVTDTDHSSFDRVAVRGLREYLVDDVTVLDTSDGIEGEQRAVAVDATGDVYVAGADEVVRVYDPDGELLRTVDGFTGDIDALAVDADGHLYTATSDAHLRKLDIAGTEVWSSTQPAAIRSVAVDGDGNVYTGDDAGIVRKLDPSGEVVWEEDGHTGAVLAVAVDAAGNVHTGGADTNVRKLDRAGEFVWTFGGHSGAVNSLAVGRDGEVRTASADGTVRRLRADGSQAWSFGGPGGHTGAVHSVAVDRQGEVFTGGEDGTARRLTVGGAQVWSHTGHTAPVLAVDADRGRFSIAGHGARRSAPVPSGVTATRSGSANLDIAWDPVAPGAGAGWFEVRHRLLGASEWTTLPRVHVPRAVIAGLDAETTHEIEVRSANDLGVSAWSEVASASTRPAAAAYSASLDDTGRRITTAGAGSWTYPSPEQVLTDVDVDEAGHTYFATATGGIHKRDAAGDELWSIDLGSAVHAVTVDADGFLYAGVATGTVHKRATSDGAPVWTSSDHGAAVLTVAVDGDGNVYTGAADGAVRRFAADGVELWSIAQPGLVVDAITVDTAGAVYTASDDGRVRKLDRDGAVLWTSQAHGGAVRAVAVDASGGVISGAEDGGVRKLAASSGSEQWRFAGHEPNGVLAVAVDADGAVYSGSTDTTVRKLTPAGTPSWSFAEHQDAVVAVTADPGRFVAAGHGPRLEPGTPGGLEADVASTTIDLSWSQVAAGTGASWYEVAYRTSGAESWVEADRTHASTMALEGLSESTTYEVRVRAVNDLSASGWADVEVRTGPAPPSELSVSAGCRPGDITLVGSTTAAVPNGGTMTLTVPDDVQPGDLLVASVAYTGTISFAQLADWTILHHGTETPLAGGVFYRFATASEPPSYEPVVTGGAAAGGITAYRGVNGASPVDAWGATQGATGAMLAPSITTTSAGSRLVASFLSLPGGAHLTPDGMDARWEASTGDGAGRPRTSVHDQMLGAADATGPRGSAVAGGDGQWIAVLVALHAPSAYAADVTWSQSISQDVDGYVLERWTGGARDPLDPWTFAADATSFTDTTLDPNLAYEYRLRATEAGRTSTAVTGSVAPGGPC